MQGGRTQMYRLTVAAQYVISEDVVMLVGDRTGITVEVELGRSRKNVLIGGMGEIFIHEDMPSSAHSEYIPPSTHDYQPISLHNNMNVLSKTTFLKVSKSYRLVSTFVRS